MVSTHPDRDPIESHLEDVVAHLTEDIATRPIWSSKSGTSLDIKFAKSLSGDVMPYLQGENGPTSDQKAAILYHKLIPVLETPKQF